MSDWKQLNDRRRREAAARELVGNDIYEGNREAFENADAVQEAARFVRQMRDYAKLSQKVLGEKLGVSQARISEIERGNSPEGVSYALLKRVARACNLPDWPAGPLEPTAGTETQSRQTADAGYPPYNIEQFNAESLRITIAVVGFASDELAVTVEGRQLVVRGKKGEKDGKSFPDFGTALRTFQRAFVLAEDIEVQGATLENGLLKIELYRGAADTVVRPAHSPMGSIKIHVVNDNQRTVTA
jgi:HSP20 family molecular chaperone IbpA/DNA-binding XRE family transcriptional regulator